MLLVLGHIANKQGGLSMKWQSESHCSGFLAKKTESIVFLVICYFLKGWKYHLFGIFCRKPASMVGILLLHH